MDNSTTPTETAPTLNIGEVIVAGEESGPRRVPVDSGTLLVVDPCLLPVDVLAALLDAQHAAIVPTGSDGLYEVAARGLGAVGAYLV